MKQYIGTKQVKAEPMTRTEAEKLLGREIKPAKAEYGDDGYLVEYEDGYKSWSPKEVFEKAYKEYLPNVGKDEGECDSCGHQFGFEKALSYLKSGEAVRRTGWSDERLFVFKQVSNYVTEDMIPKMRSLPVGVKNMLLKCDNPHILYKRQMIIIDSYGMANSWSPSTIDIFANDWEVVKKCTFPGTWKLYDSRERR